MYIKSGGRVMPTLVIEDLVVGLTLNDSCHCVVLTKTGLIHLWDLQKGASVLNRVSVRSLLSKKGETFKTTRS